MNDRAVHAQLRVLVPGQLLAVRGSINKPTTLRVVSLLALTPVARAFACGQNRLVAAISSHSMSGSGTVQSPRSRIAASASLDGAPATPIAALLHTCKLAVAEISSELVTDVYAMLEADPGGSIRKADKSHFSMADGFVQALLERLLRGRVGEIVGEEEANVNIETPPYSAGGIVAPERFNAKIERLRDLMDELSSGPLLAAAGNAPGPYGTLTAFIDPIDGTKEFCTGKGEQCAVMVGFAEMATGMAVGGLVYRPLCEHKSHALGCKGEDFFTGVLRPAMTADGEAAGESSGGTFLRSNGGVSDFLVALQSELGFEECKAGGAGNKAMMVLEQPNAAYIQDRGVSRWDSCAPQAIVEAAGGCFVKLAPLLASPPESKTTTAPPLEGYKYVKSALNSDFVPNLATLTKYNAQSNVLSEADVAKGAEPRLATSAEQLKPYANTCGLFALKDASAEKVATAHAAVVRAAARSAPKFD